MNNFVNLYNLQKFHLKRLFDYLLTYISKNTMQNIVLQTHTNCSSVSGGTTL